MVELRPRHRQQIRRQVDSVEVYRGDGYDQ
jgi:hypothetical protein